MSSTILSLYERTPRQAYKDISRIMDAGLVPFLEGPPGIGKSALFKKYAGTRNHDLIDHRLSTSAPEDMSGLPKFITRNGVERATFVPFDIFPLTSDPIPDGKNGWTLFLDEMNSATKMVQAAAYKVVLDRKTGQESLHEKLSIGAAGNQMTDRAITNNLSTAMQSRLVHVKMIISFKEWLLDVALPQQYDERIVAFLNYDANEAGVHTTTLMTQGGSALFDFRPDHQDRTFACPRTWEFMNNMVKGKEITSDDTALFSGVISSSWAAAFVQFCEIYRELMTVKDIMADPLGANVHMSADRKWALVSHLMNKVTAETVEGITAYINRLDLSSRILFLRGLLRSQPDLRQQPDILQLTVNLAQYLKNDEE